jgi:hypothetical protein
MQIPQNHSRQLLNKSGPIMLNIMELASSKKCQKSIFSHAKNQSVCEDNCAGQAMPENLLICAERREQ